MLSHRRLLVVAYLLFLAPRTTEAFFIRFLLCLLFPKGNFCPIPIPPPTPRPIRPPPTPPPTRRPIAPTAPVRPTTPRPIAPTAPTRPPIVAPTRPPTPRPVVPPPNPPVVGPPNPPPMAGAGPPNAPFAGPPTTTVVLPEFRFAGDIDKKFLPLSTTSGDLFSACIVATRRRFNTELVLHRGQLGGYGATIDSVNPTTVCMSTGYFNMETGGNLARLESVDQPGDYISFSDLLWFGSQTFNVVITNTLFNDLPRVTVTVGLVDDNEVEAQHTTGANGVTPAFVNIPPDRVFFVRFFRADGFWGGSAVKNLGTAPFGHPFRFYVDQPRNASRIDNNDFSMGTAAGWSWSEFSSSGWYGGRTFGNIVPHWEPGQRLLLRRELEPDYDFSFCLVPDPDALSDPSFDTLSRSINTPVGAKTFVVRYRYATNTGGAVGPSIVGRGLDGYQINYRGKGEAAVGSEANSWYGLRQEGDPMSAKVDTDSSLYTSKWRTFTRPISAGATTVQLEINLYLKPRVADTSKSCIIVDYMTTK